MILVSLTLSLVSMAVSIVVAWDSRRLEKIFREYEVTAKAATARMMELAEAQEMRNAIRRAGV